MQIFSILVDNLGFQVFSRNCSNRHGMIGKKYELLLEKVYEQLELATWVGEHFNIHPTHHHFKQYYYQEWDERDRYIHDHIYPLYFSQDQAKNANGGVWSADLTKIRLQPGGVNYIYNVMTGYHSKALYGMEFQRANISIRKYFNISRYFDHMIIGMPRQLYDGILDYEDGTPASTSQMVNDVSNFICFMQRRSGHSYPEKQARKWMIFFRCMLLLPFRYLKIYGYFRSLLSTRTEVYAVRDHLDYKHWKTGQKSMKTNQYKSNYWC